MGRVHTRWAMWREETHWGFLVSDLVGNVWRKKEGCSPFPEFKWGRERETLKEKLIKIWMPTRRWERLAFCLLLEGSLGSILPMCPYFYMSRGKTIGVGQQGLEKGSIWEVEHHPFGVYRCQDIQWIKWKVAKELSCWYLTLKDGPLSKGALGVRALV